MMRPSSLFLSSWSGLEIAKYLSMVTDIVR